MLHADDSPADPLADLDLALADFCFALADFSSTAPFTLTFLPTPLKKSLVGAI